MGGARLRAAIFDLDGVLTDTASVHAQAWKQTFDGFLRERSRRGEARFEPFDLERDYLAYVDGKPRFAGVRSFLQGRGIGLPEGRLAEGPQAQTVIGLGLRKNQRYLELLREGGRVAVFDTTVSLIRTLRARRVATAVVSSSRNCRLVLQLTGLEDLFDARVDGLSVERHGLRGKPDPDMFLRAAADLALPPAASAVFEDAASGVQAGRRGHFALVIGIDRGGNRAALQGAGADRVVADLGELTEKDIDAWFKAPL